MLACIFCLILNTLNFYSFSFYSDLLTFVFCFRRIVVHRSMAAVSLIMKGSLIVKFIIMPNVVRFVQDVTNQLPEDA